MLDDVDRVHKASTSPKGPTICELDELLGESSNTRQGEKIQPEDYLVPHLTHETEEEPDASYKNSYVVMSPEEEMDIEQPSPWLLSDGSDFDSEAMTPVNPLLINMPSSNFEDAGNEQGSNQTSHKKDGSVKMRGRKILIAKKKPSKYVFLFDAIKILILNYRKNRDILQETMNLINLEPQDLASPGSSGATAQNLKPEENIKEDDAESSAKILKILQDVASQPTTSRAVNQDFQLEDDKTEALSDSSNLALAKPNPSFNADNVARYVPPM